jgi:CHAD domain-containing protein
MATHFELPTNLTAELLVAILTDRLTCQHFSKQPVLKAYYDSFDWRLYRHEIICELNQSAQQSLLQLSNRKNGQPIASTPLHEVPAFSKQFEDRKMRKNLEPVLEMRALQVVCTLECVVYQFDIVDDDKQVAIRVMIEEFEQLNDRLVLFPVKGHSKVAHHVSGMVLALGLTLADKPVLLDALRLQGRKPKDYSSKLDILLIPEIRADIACKTLFSHLLQVIRANEQGVIDNTDSEFLHDFRVAIRRTRVGLGQFKNVFPEDTIRCYKDFFSWLGQITGETRDLDVTLLDFDRYQKHLPTELRPSLTPLCELIAQKHWGSQQQLAKELCSDRYSSQLAEWEAYLRSPSSKNPAQTDAQLSIKELADQQIWKMYRQAITQGEAIGLMSPPKDLHTLRKTCKKLRYLMEFFQSLYAQRHLSNLMKILKRLQNVLGEFQDYTIQQKRLMQICKEMQATDSAAQTILALQLLIGDFDDRKNKVREHFTWQFSAFKKAENHKAFKALFAPHHGR